MNKTSKAIQQFEKGTKVLAYMERQNVKITNHVVKYLEVYKEDGYRLDYFANTPFWVLLPKAIAKKTSHIKVCGDGLIKAESKDNQVLLSIASERTDDILTPQICFLGSYIK